jgi:hypothetical protein
MTLEPDHSRRLLIAAVAGGALVCGALAAVTGEATIAMVAGVLSVAVAGLSFRLVLVPSDQEPVVEIDLDVIDVADPVPVAEPELANTRPGSMAAHFSRRLSMAAWLLLAESSGRSRWFSSRWFHPKTKALVPASSPRPLLPRCGQLFASPTWRAVPGRTRTP